MGTKETIDEELKNLATVAEYMHGGIVDAHKVTRSFTVMLDLYGKNKGFATDLSYLVTEDLQKAYGEIDHKLKPDLSNLYDPELQKPLAGYMPSKQQGKIANTADLIMAVLPADGQLKLGYRTKAEVYKFLVQGDEEKTRAMDDAVKSNNTAFIDEKFGKVVEVLFGSKENHEIALDKMAKHPGLNCPGCEIQLNMNVTEQKAQVPTQLKNQLGAGKALKIE